MTTQAPAQREPDEATILIEALTMAASRFEDIATIIERDGSYTNVEFFRKKR